MVPFTKESPFLIPFKKTFSMMRRVRVLTDIFKNYQPHEVKQCSSGMVINILICSRVNKLYIFLKIADIFWIQTSKNTGFDFTLWTSCKYDYRHDGKVYWV